MVSLEQVQLLESRVARAIEYVGKLTAENSALASEKSSLMSKLDACQKRVDELEVLVMRFKDEQSRIEDGIISALDRLNQFEEAVEKSLKERQTAVKPAAEKHAAPVASEKTPAKPKEPEEPEPPEEKEVYFEIPEAEAEDDADARDGDSEGKGLDIF
jgi:FtsZ-binding cell division protein ZapB